MRFSKNFNLTSVPLVLILCSFTLLFSCGDDDEPGLAIPVILSVSQSSGSPGDVVTITGTDLAEATSVSFNGTAATITSNSDTEIVTTVPENATTGLISVVTEGGTAVSGSDFEVIIVGAATVTSVSRISAQQGENITLTGTDMSTVSQVTIGGEEAT
ncbi:MAG: IPT/TIG domain-containing protein, partial [Cyclobacteriaceae bacterium]